MPLNVQVSPQYQGVVEPAGSPQHTTVNDLNENFASLSGIPSGFVGTARVGTDLYVGDGVTLNLIKSTNPIYNFKPETYNNLANAIRKTIHKTSNTRIIFCGDSILQGANEQSQNLQYLGAYTAQASELLSNSLCPAGYQSHYGATTSADFLLNAVDTRITNYPTAWINYNNQTIGYGTAQNSSTVDPITYTPNVATNTIDVHYFDVAGADSIVVKAGATTIANIAITGTNNIKKAVCTTGATAALNVYTIQKATANAANCFIAGYEAYDSAKPEISLINVGINTQFVDSWLSAPLFNPYTPVTALTASSVKPDAVAIMYGSNHWLDIITHPPAQFQTNLQYVVSALLAGNVNVFLMTPPPCPAFSATIANQKLYVDIIRRVAMDYNIAVIDVWGAWGGDWTIGYVKGWYRANLDQHPSRIGYGVIAKYVSNFINAIL